MSEQQKQDQGETENGQPQAPQTTGRHGWMAGAWKRLARRYVRMYENALRREMHYRSHPCHPLAPFQSESICQACGGPNITWFAPNDVWNRVMPDDGGILCPTCFAHAAAAAGIRHAIWRFAPEAERPERAPVLAVDPSRSPPNDALTTTCHVADP
jgi:hypothetical protein